MTEFRYILDHVGSDEVLAQLEEECSELIQAASKLRRAMSQKNPTPVSFEDARDMLVEEFADVCLCADILGVHPESLQVFLVKEKKLQRWCGRINREEFEKETKNDASRDT